jgi:hypothetical protein
VVILLIIFIIFLLFFLKQKENFTWTCAPVKLPGFDSEGRVLRINESLFSTKNQGYHIKEISNIYESGGISCKIEKNIDDDTYKSNNLCILFYNSKSDNYPREINNFMAPTPKDNQDTNKVFGGFGKMFDNNFVYDSKILTEANEGSNDYVYEYENNEGSIIFDFKFKFFNDDKKILIETGQEQDLIHSLEKSFRIFFRNTKDKGLRLGVFNNSLPNQSTDINKLIHGNSLDPRESYKKILYSNKEFNKLDHNRSFRCAITFKYVHNDKNLSVNMILEDKDVFNKFGINEPTFIGKSIFSVKVNYKFIEKDTNLIINENYKLNQTEPELDKNQVIFNNKYMSIVDYKQSYLTGESRNLVEGVIHSFDVHKRFLNGYFYETYKYEDVSMIFRAFDCNIFNEFCECEKITYYPTLRFYQVNNDNIKKVFDYPLGKNIHWQWVSSWMMGWNRYNIDKIDGDDVKNKTRQSGYDEGSKLGESSFPNIGQILSPKSGTKYEKKLNLYDGSHRWAYWPRTDASGTSGETALEFIENSINCI